MGQSTLKLPGFELTETLHRSDTSVVCRARRVLDGELVVIKRSVGTSLSPRQFTRYRNEFELLHKLDSGGVIKVLDLVRHEGQIALVLENFPGLSLSQWMQGSDSSLVERLEIAAQLAATLARVHAADVIHKDINPHNILYDPASRRCKLIDFGIATRLRSEESCFRMPAALEGTLAYMAPEQTGRMNRTLDCRADLYSFGLTLYELFTGTLPHEEADPLETIHFHLAGRPAAPADRDGDVPKVLSDLIMKLLRKAPERRYQSAAGVAADLQRCLEELEKGGSVSEFTLAQRDLLDRFEAPQKLYGRKLQTAAIVEAFERVAGGRVETVLVSGVAGVGKTALVHELLEPITRRRGYFAAGKFDRFQVDVPLSGLVMALHDLVHQLLTESEESIASWRTDIQDAVGANGRLVTDLIPDVELIIGPQASLRRVDPAEERNRFNMAFRRFIQAFGRRNHPLVLFLDDVQWADPASLALMEMILSAQDMESLLLVQAYRNSDVEIGHPLLMTLDQHRNRGVATVELKLDSLAAEDIAQLVAEALHEPPEAAAPLARIIGEKTGGNPFFVRQFLQMLHAEKLISFNPDTNSFRYDLEAIKSTKITENVVELLAARLEKLPSATQRVLQLAAAIGDQFDLDSLAEIYGERMTTAARHLQPALDEGLVVPMSDLESVDPDQLDSELLYRRYSFLHDRVRQVAYAAIEEAARPALHLALGRALLVGKADGALERRLFDIVNHMNQGVALIDDPVETARLVDLNVSAGNKAKLSTAYAMAVRCYKQAAELLGDDAWRLRYALCYDVHLWLAESLWLKADFAAAFDVIEEAVSRSLTDLDKARLYTIETAAHLSMGNMPEALVCGRRAARLVSIELPEDDDAIATMLNEEIDSIVARTSGVGIKNLLELPVMTDQEKLAAMALLTHCLPAAYQSNQSLFALLCCKMVSLSLEHGNCPLSARAYGSFAALQSSVFGRYSDAYRFAKLGVDLCRRFDDSSVLSAAYFLWAMFASHWNKPIDESIELFRQSVQYGQQTGDHQHAGYSAARRISHLMFRGLPLDELKTEAEEALELLNRIGDATNLDFLPPRIALIDWLAGHRPGGDTLRVWNLREEQGSAAIRARGNRSFESDWLTVLVTQRYFSGDYEAAFAFAEEAAELLQFSAGFVTRVEHELYAALTFAALHRKAAEARRKDLTQRLERSARQLRIWAEACPRNFSSMQLLVEAELARIRGDGREAMHLYDRAIVAASADGFINIEALAAELAARFWFEEKKADFGQTYLQKSLHAYERWGAHGRVADLFELYGEELPRTGAPARTAGSTLPTSSERSDALDLGTVLKASQAIATEILLDRLLTTLLDIILENAGAESGALALKADGKFIVQASKSASATTAELDATPLNRSDALSAGIAYYVVRTHEHVVLADPAESGNFRNDPYVRERRPKSVLCAPVLRKGELTGVLYLENNQVSGAFTPDRLEALNILLSQIAVSIDNAQLYAAAEQQKEAIERANVKLTSEIGERERAEREIRRYQDHLEELVKERTAALESAQGRLVDVSRKAGMAEVAAGVLHNVGNVMNSVNVGASVTRDSIRALGVERLAAVCDLLEEHENGLGEYLTSDTAGRKIPQYLRKLAEALESDKGAILGKIDHVLEHLEHMKKIIGAQQNYAKISGVMEVCRLADIAETAISISEAALRHGAIEIVREYQDMPPVSVDRHQIMQILVNLISNAKHALEDCTNVEKRLIVRIASDPEIGARIEVEDNGIGIPRGNLTKIFNHGFTTKKKGHGFGLHNCANGAQQMSGSLTAYSDGQGSGARFVLRFPIDYATHPVLRLDGDGSEDRTLAAG